MPKMKTFTVQVSPKVMLTGHVVYSQPTRSASTNIADNNNNNNNNNSIDNNKIFPLNNVPCVILVHQWSKLGGMEDLMRGIGGRLAKRGYPSVTFNLRGVGSSTGSSTWSGCDEVEDVVSVVKFSEERLGARNIYLLGSSAGAPVAGSALKCSPSVKGYVGVGYPFGALASVFFRAHYDEIMNSDKPKLLITGTSDGFTSVKEFERRFDRMKEPKRKVLVPDIGHFKLESAEYDELVVEETIRFIEEFNA